jgi:hypothetical protein
MCEERTFEPGAAALEARDAERAAEAHTPAHWACPSRALREEEVDSLA